MKKRGSSKIQIIAVAVTLALAAVTFAAALTTKMLPGTYLAALAALLLVPAGLVALLTRDPSRRGACAAGLALAAVFVVGAGLTSAMTFRGVSVLKAGMNASVSISPTFNPPPTAEPTPESTPEPTPEPTAEPVLPDTFTIYVSGIDSREGLVDKSYGDVNILVTVDRTTHQIVLVATPRDSYVYTAVSGDMRDKLTHAGQFGIEAQVETMEKLYDRDIDYWFRMDFSGFERIIDALGGVTVHSDYTFTAFNGVEFKEGDNELNGKQALSFARERKSFGSEGDIQRDRHQLEIISAMADKVLTLDFLQNYTQVLDLLGGAFLQDYTQVLEAFDGAFETTVPYDLLAAMVRDQLADGRDWNIVRYVVTGEQDLQVTYLIPEEGPRYVMWIDDEDLAEAKQLMDGVLAGETVTQP